MPETETPPVEKLRVLLADDSPETRRSTRIMLSLNTNVTLVAVAINGAQAVELAREHHPDILLLDVNMPEKDGLTAYKEISKIYPETGCIIITAEKQLITLDTAMALGVQEYLVKPFTLEELNDAVDRVSAGIDANRKRLAKADSFHKKNEAYLRKMGDEYAKLRRTDDQAVDVFEQLAADPDCDLRWLKILATVYIVRQEWGKLKHLAARLEEQTKTKP